MMTKIRQFSVKALSLQHHKHKHFVVSSWQRGDSALPMLIVRLFELLLTGGVFIWSLIGEDSYYLIYMTNWGLIVNTLTFLSAFLVSLCAALRGISEDGIPVLTRIYWFFYNISVTTAFFITLFYWILLYDYSAEPDVSSNAFWLDIATHGLNSFALLIELVVSNTPCRLAHFYLPLGLGVWYTLFSVIYYFAGGTDALGNPYVYDVLDWSDPGPTGALVGVTTALIIGLHIFHFVVASIRSSIASACVKRVGHDFPFVLDQVNYA